MRFIFHPQADAELDEAAGYYDEQSPRLGLEFLEEVYATVARITVYPHAGSPCSKNTRRCILNRFPYGVIYRVRAGLVDVIAVANLQRRPGYWKKRI